MSFTYSSRSFPDGHKFFYSDSGPVPGSTTYSTLVIIHGSAFNGYGFEKMHESGPKHNIRTIIIQRPGYRGSSQYSDIELQDAINGHQSFLDGFQNQLAHFLHYIVTELNVPKADRTSKTGGIAVMGWSLGVIHLLTLIGNPDSIPKEIYDIIEPQVTDVIIYESPNVCLGLVVPEMFNQYDVWLQKGKTLDEMYQDFLIWVSSYYDHKNPDSMEIEDLDLRIHEGSVCTVHRMTPEELEKGFDSASAIKVDFPLLGPPMMVTITKQTERALFNRELAAKFFPNLQISYVTGLRTEWHVITGKVLLKKKMEAQGNNLRPIRFLEIENGNHFIHYDAPEALVTASAQLMRT